MLSRHHRAHAEAQTEARALWSPGTLLFPEQFKVCNDNASRIVVDGSRRCGKSFLAAVLLLATALGKAKAKCLFLALTREDARDLVWQDLTNLNATYAHGGVPNEQRLELRFPNGSRIRLGGAKDRMQAERWRGRFFDLVIIDECQTFPSHLRDLVESVLKPTMLGGDASRRPGEAPRGRRGRIVLMGTPGEVPGVGYWEERVADPGWSHHQWILDQNPHLGTPAEITEFLADMARSMGGEDAPAFQREFRGNRKEGDRLDRPYHYSKAKNHYTSAVLVSTETKEVRHTRWSLPLGGHGEGFWQFVFGIDLGKRAASAICVWGITDAAPGKIWLIEEYLVVGVKNPAIFADKIQELRTYYSPQSMWVDEGALGVMICDQWRAPPYSLPVRPAEKLAIEVQADFLSAALSRGDVMIPSSSRMAADMVAVRWDPELLKKGKRKEALEPHSDIIPAGRYGFKHAYAIAQATHAPSRAPTDEERERAILEAERMEASEKARRLMQGLPAHGGRAGLNAWKG